MAKIHRHFLASEKAISNFHCAISPPLKALSRFGLFASSLSARLHVTVALRMTSVCGLRSRVQLHFPSRDSNLLCNTGNDSSIF